MQKSIVLVLFFLAVLSVGPFAQTPDEIKPPSETVSRTQLEKWLTQALVKYGKYKNLSTSVAISSAKFSECTLGFDLVRRPNAIDTRTDSAVSRTNKVTQNVSIDVSRIAADGITIEDYLDPDLRALIVSLTNGSKTEIIVRHDAAGAIRTAFARLRTACSSGT